MMIWMQSHALLQLVSQPTGKLQGKLCEARSSEPRNRVTADHLNTGVLVALTILHAVHYITNSFIVRPSPKKYSTTPRDLW